uniref:Cytochrome c oxidase subunit 3 n=1 Tax=Barbronia cf. gwalagwalensis LYKG002 TaxID=3021307 RepID=A0AA96MJG0_9ANNE|nr:cytochrome c oxidase subunit 3 [Barbronia cf. gwalagwalensis LYKG002]
MNQKNIKLTRQPFHLVEPSPWPLTSSAGALALTMGLTSWFHNQGIMCLLIGVIMIILSMILWWRDVIRESTYAGNHTSYVVKGLRIGMILFITSEICFFFGFFWAFFHSSLVPAVEVGCTWPPIGIKPLNPFSVPLLNTIVLLASGVTVTWAHHGLKAGKRNETMYALIMTVGLGLYFTILQANEYFWAPFTIADSIYGSTFFVSTGFHGAHVIIGSLFLITCLFRTMKWHFSSDHHFGFEAAAWYWHFVDVVWICLYLCIYWWGS